MSEISPASSESFDNKLTIDTPEQTQLEFPLAGIGSRFLAIAIDTLIQTAAGFVLFFIVLFIRSYDSALLASSSNWTLAILGLGFFTLEFGYFAIFEAVWNGQTPGKRLMKLRVIQDSGRPINAFQSVARNLVRIIDEIPGVYAVGIISAILSSQNRRLGDFVAGTVVVHEKPVLQASPGWRGPVAGELPDLRPVRLDASELQLIETFLLRRDALQDEVRQRMAAQILASLSGKLSRVLPAGPRGFPGGDEALLEALAKGARESAGYR